MIWTNTDSHQQRTDTQDPYLTEETEVYVPLVNTLAICLHIVPLAEPFACEQSSSQVPEDLGNDPYEMAPEGEFEEEAIGYTLQNVRGHLVAYPSTDHPQYQESAITPTAEDTYGSATYAESAFSPVTAGVDHTGPWYPAQSDAQTHYTVDASHLSPSYQSGTHQGYYPSHQARTQEAVSPMTEEPGTWSRDSYVVSPLTPTDGGQQWTRSGSN